MWKTAKRIKHVRSFLYGPFGGRDAIKSACLSTITQTLQSLSKGDTPALLHDICNHIKKCTETKNLAAGRSIHIHAVANGIETFENLGDHLIRFYGSNGLFFEASIVFCQIQKPSVYTWHAIILASVNSGKHELALQLYDQMQEDGIAPNKFVFTCALKASKCIAHTKGLHTDIVNFGLESDLAVSSTLIDTYVKHGSVQEAQSVFNGIPNPDIVSWGAMITGYSQNGYHCLALEIYGRMQNRGIHPDKIRFLSILKTCSNIGESTLGKIIHMQIIEKACEFDIAIGCSLVDMYAKCGDLCEAEKVLQSLESRDVVVWSALIGGYAQHGYDTFALNIFKKMLQDGIGPNKVVHMCVLKVCGVSRILWVIMLLHIDLYLSGFESDISVVGTLIESYAKCGNLDEAQCVFDRCPDRNITLWYAIIAGYTREGRSASALVSYEKMLEEGVKPNKSVYVCIIKACSDTGSLEQGFLMNHQVLKSSLETDDMIGSMLVDMYAKCKDLNASKKMFNSLSSPDIVSWGSIISGYSQNGDGAKALELFERMSSCNLVPDKVIYLSVLKACGDTRDIRLGQMLHDSIVRDGLQSDLPIRNTLIDMYAKCGLLSDAYKIFKKRLERDIISWSIMISGCVKYGRGMQALELFEEMEGLGVLPDKIIFLSVLKACTILKLLAGGRLVHKKIIWNVFEKDLDIKSAVIDMYSKCGNLEDARKVFEDSVDHDVVTWGAMVAGYVDGEDGATALDLFSQMLQQGIMCNEFVVVSSLRACGTTGSIHHGKLIHNFILESKFDGDVFVMSALIDMYGKCGLLMEAQSVFDNLPHPDIVSWGALIEGYAHHGHPRLSLACINEMQRKGLKPHDAIYLSALSACSHVGREEEVKECLSQMKLDHDMKPNKDHLNCIVDLFSRAGHLEDAYQLLNSMPSSHDSAGWISLLTACKIHGNMDLGRYSFTEVSNVDSRYISEGIT